MTGTGLEATTDSGDIGKDSNDQKPVTLLISGIRGHSFPRLGLLKRPKRFYLHISTKGKTKVTTVSGKSDNPTWEDSFAIETDATSTVTFQVYSKANKWAPDQLIGSVNEEVSSLMALEDTDDFTCVLVDPQRDSQTEQTIQFKVKYIYDSGSIKKVVEQSRQAVEDLVPVPRLFEHAEDSANQLTSAVHAITSVLDPWEPLLNKVELFTVLVDRIAEIHPYAKMAWSVLSIAHQVILAQKNRDKTINDLVSVMNDALSFVSESEPLKKIESHKSIIECMAQQVVECAYFIREYAKNKNFWQRSLKYAISDVDKKIEKFSQRLEEFKASLQSRVIVQTEIIVLRILDNLADMATDMAANVNLAKIHYAEGAGYIPEKGCLPGTREEIITDIVDWVNLPDGEDTQRVLWLSGVAGSGKSAIAHNIARQFDRQKRLGSFFCFDTSRCSERHPCHLFGTISLDISHLDNHWKKALLNIVKDNYTLLSTPSVQLQFESFLLGPSANLTTVGPIVIVIDALDESGDPAARGSILAMLSKRSCELPSNFRIIITSRPENDIENVFGNNPNVCRRRMDTIIQASSNDNDITAFFRSQLSELPSLDDEWFSDAQCRRLVDASEGLFQWAATACLFIQGNGKGLSDPSYQFDLLFSESSRGRNGLDSLYHTVLERVWPTNVALEKPFRLVVGRILATKEPLSISALSELRDKDEPAKAAGFTLRSLGSLFSGVAEHSQPVRLLHTSIRDFFTDRERSGRFHIDPSLYHRQLTLTCFRVMKDGLRFNICNLETSYLRNTEIPDLPSRIANNIPSHLDYSCRFWAIHLRSLQFDGELMESFRGFLYEQFLYWLEIMSVNGIIRAVPRAILEASQWCENHDTDVNAFIKDAKRFIATFSNTIAQSVPHIYLSALPFAPKESLVSTTFLPKFSNTIFLQTGKLGCWPVLENVIEGHQSHILSVSFSPDGRWIVSGSEDGTVRIWDVEIGVPVSPLLKGESRVSSVAFSSNGKISSGSWDGTIRLWDVETGEMIGPPLHEHTHPVTSVRFSPDGSKLISGSWDETVRLWDVETCNSIGLFKGHTTWVYSIAFSPNGELIVSASMYGAIGVWNANTGWSRISPPGNKDEDFSCFAFSPSGEYVAAGSKWEIRLWNITEGPFLARTFKGHMHKVTDIAFSPSGKYIVSSSYDNTIRLWEVESGKAVGVPLEEHTGPINAIAFSPDGKRVASGSNDNTIRLWDVKAWIAASPQSEKELLDGSSPSGSGTSLQTLSQDPTSQERSRQSKGHGSDVYSLAFSPDGKQIASGAGDNTVRIWDSETGDDILRPWKGHQDDVRLITYSPDGKCVASASGVRDNTIRLWNAETGETVCPSLELDSLITAITFSPDGTRIACGWVNISGAGKIFLYDTTTGERVGSPFIGWSFVTSFVFSPDGSRIVSCSNDGMVEHWDVETSKAIGDPYLGYGRDVLESYVSPDMKHVISSTRDHKIILYDAKTCTAIGPPFIGHTRSIRDISFSPDRKLIVSGSNDMTVRIWDIGTHSSCAIFTWHSGTIRKVAFSPDGRRIASASSDKAARVWNVDAAMQASSLRPGSSLIPSFEVSSHTEKGWVMDCASNLIFWVPSWYRAGLCWPPNTVLVHENPVNIDLSRFKYGEAWMQCKT